MNNRKKGMRIHVTSPAGTLLGIIVLGIIIGCAAGFFITAVYPALANVAAPFACSNGSLLTQQSSASQQPGSVTIQFKAYCAVNGVQQNITSQVLMTNGGIFAVVTPIVLVLVCMLIGVM
jgi:hypothetical protein